MLTISEQSLRALTAQATRTFPDRLAAFLASRPEIAHLAQTRSIETEARMLAQAALDAGFPTEREMIRFAYHSVLLRPAEASGRFDVCVAFGLPHTAESLDEIEAAVEAVLQAGTY